MSTAEEELRALKNTREFLLDIASLRITDIRKQSSLIRKKAIILSRHYPYPIDLDKLYEGKL